MKYIIIPSSIITLKIKLQFDEMGLSPRVTNDGSKTLLHLEHYSQIFEPNPKRGIKVGGEIEEIYKYPVYTTEEIIEELKSPEWQKEVS